MEESPTFPFPNSKAELLAQIDVEYAAFKELVESVPPDERTTPLVEALSIKDLVAHVFDWQEYLLRRMRATAVGETLPYRVPPGGGFDEVNAQIYETHRERPWNDVWGDFERSVQEMRAELEQLSEEDLFDPARTVKVMGLPDDRAVDYVVGNTAEHYWEHAQEIRARRAQRQGE